MTKDRRIFTCLTLLAKVASESWKNLDEIDVPVVVLRSQYFRQYLGNTRPAGTITAVLVFRDLKCHETELDGQEKLHDDTEEN